MYSLRDYGDMIVDHLRMDAYAQALKSVIRPETVVLDIGAATGIHSLLACKFGARHVYAIEPNEHIFLAEALAEENGFAERITFYQDISTAVTLPETADVIVSDLRGALPLFGHHIPSIVDARQRHLKPGGVLIPSRDQLFVAVVEARIPYNDLIRPWDDPYALKMEKARRIVLNSWSADNTDLIEPRHLLTAPILWVELDYQTIVDPNVIPPKLSLQAARSGTAHGLLIWFDAILTADIGFSNAPGKKKAANVYGRGFFPFLDPVPLAKGDLIDLELTSQLIEQAYEWNWGTRIFNQADRNDLKASFNQSTLNA